MFVTDTARRGRQKESYPKCDIVTVTEFTLRCGVLIKLTSRQELSQSASHRLLFFSLSQEAKSENKHLSVKTSKTILDENFAFHNSQSRFKHCTITLQLFFFPTILFFSTLPCLIPTPAKIFFHASFFLSLTFFLVFLSFVLKLEFFILYCAIINLIVSLS